jgi:hypothetical protein
MKAIEKTLAQRRFDEIILSTLPPGISLWLAWDLPHRVRARTDVPLTVITSRSGRRRRTTPYAERRRDDALASKCFKQCVGCPKGGCVMPAGLRSVELVQRFADALVRSIWRWVFGWLYTPGRSGYGATVVAHRRNLRGRCELGQ